MDKKRVVFAFMALAAVAAAAAPLDSQPMPQVDLTRYMGRWYEVARYPSRFERGCHGVTADYSLRPDGKVSVLNTCRKGGLAGPVKTASATAWPVAPGNSRFKVRFFWPFTAPYWVVALDPEYRWALVGHPERRYFWILSRTPRLAPDLEAGLLARMRELGYDPAKLERGEQ